MRFLKIIPILLLVIANASCIGIAFDEAAFRPGYYYSDEPKSPRGSYKDSCKECSVRNNVLSCSCADVDMRWYRTTLNIKNCHQAISNEDGRLKCGAAVVRPIVVKPVIIKPVAPRPIDLPLGTYKDSCSSCYMSGTYLSCSCKNAEGSNRSASLETRSCYKSIANDDGRLVCGDVAEKLPSGSYSQSCNSCRINNGLLSCACQDERGSYLSSSLYVSGCRQDVSNDNGRLICGTPKPKAPVALPRGSYQQSCKRCEVSNNRLSCSCENENGTSNQTSLSLQGCYSSIENCNGRLTCGDC